MAIAHDLSDWLSTLKEYVSRTQKGINIYSIGGKRTSGDNTLFHSIAPLGSHIYAVQGIP